MREVFYASVPGGVLLRGYDRIRRKETLTVAWLTSHKEAVCAVLQAHVETGSHAHRHARVQQPEVRAACPLPSC